MQISTTPVDSARSADRTGTMLSVAGLVAWLTAMLLAIAGPLLGIQVPPLVIVGMVAFSGAFSILSLPKLVGGPKTEHSNRTHA